MAYGLLAAPVAAEAQAAGKVYRVGAGNEVCHPQPLTVTTNDSRAWPVSWFV
jgi:hypothetical protein